MTDQAVRVERSAAVTTVFLHRPARRNAVDGPTAAQLAAAFRAFDADPGAAVAVLYGEGGVFCSGADLTALGTGRGNRVAPGGDGPMGISRLRLSRVTRPRGERDRIRQVGRQRQGLRATDGHHHRRMEVRAIEFSERRDGVTHLRQPLARCRHRKAQLTQFVLDPGSPGADAHLKAALGEHRQ